MAKLLLHVRSIFILKAPPPLMETHHPLLTVFFLPYFIRLPNIMWLCRTSCRCPLPPLFNFHHPHFPIDVEDFFYQKRGSISGRAIAEDYALLSFPEKVFHVGIFPFTLSIPKFFFQKQVRLAIMGFTLVFTSFSSFGESCILFSQQTSICNPLRPGKWEKFSNSCYRCVFSWHVYEAMFVSLDSEDPSSCQEAYAYYFHFLILVDNRIERV